MLTIRPAQIKVFEGIARQRFEDEMVVHCREFSPVQCELIGEELVRVVLRRAIKRAAGYGFTYRGPVRLAIELSFLYGSDFDTDPQYLSLNHCLYDPDDQMQRADRLSELVLDYQEKVPDLERLHNARPALENMLAFAKQPAAVTAHDWVPGMRRVLHRGFPRRAEYLGGELLTTLIHNGCAAARERHFPVRGEALLVTLLLILGHGCVDDPLYPWISNTLNDQNIVDPANRVDRLEKEALSWIQHALTPSRQGALS